MKRYLITFLGISIMSTSFYTNPVPSPLHGAWKMQEPSGEVVIIIQDGYLSHTSFDKTSKKFIQTHGGNLKADGNKLVLQCEFNTEFKEKIGTSLHYTFSINDDKLILIHNGIEEKWERIDDNKEVLAGTWQISARMQDEKMNLIKPGARKTLKILSATRFQWIAINTETKEFFGTGGGTYTFIDGKYTETIEFFSRDSSRVGASLTFEGKVDNKVWTHKGMNSKGELLHEEWGRE